MRAWWFAFAMICGLLFSGWDMARDNKHLRAVTREQAREIEHLKTRCLDSGIQTRAIERRTAPRKVAI